jgi:hypothetical protein
MRAALAFVLGWFGVQELHSPSDWGVFVPAAVLHHAPHAVNDLVLLHGFLLTLAAASILLGVAYLGGSLLAVGMLCEVILQLWVDGGVTDVLIRDVGVLGLAAALLVDPARVWHLDDAILARVRAARQPTRKEKRAHLEPVPLRVVSWTRVGSGVALALAVLAFAAVLRVTGTSGSALPPESSLLASRATPTASAATSDATATPPTASEGSPTPNQSEAAPTPGATVTSILFTDWRYRNKSFQVYPGPISSEAKRALAGFDLSVQDQGSQVVLFLKALSPRYHDASIPLDKGNTAYFVETSMHDDPNDQENNLNDDGVVVVTPSGYIVQG